MMSEPETSVRRLFSILPGATPKPKIVVSRNLLLWGFVAGVFYWIVDAAIMDVVFADTSLREELFHPSVHEIWERSVVMALLVLLGGIMQRLLQQRQLAQQRAEQASALLLDAIDSLSEGFALYDQEDRLVLFNRNYTRFYPKCADLLVIGSRYEDMLREASTRGQFPAARDRMEDWVAECVEAHQSCDRNTEYSLGDDRWVLASDYRTRDGSTVAIRADITDRKVLERELIEVVNREQMKIASDLHDGVGQELTAATLLLSGLQKDLEKVDKSGAFRLGEATALIAQCVSRIREFSQILLPVELGAGELMHALERLAHSFESLYGLHCRFNCGCSAPVYDAKLSNHLYRIAQEAVTNVLRHAKASEIDIRCASDNGNFTLAVEDDGIGIPSRSQRNGGLGLRIMEYRASLIGGSLQVERSPTGGTTVACTCPCPDR